MKFRAAVYIDGFNLYFGLRNSSGGRFLWLNLRAMCQELLRPDQDLVSVKYFTARISAPPDKHVRQKTFLEAVATLGGVQTFFGQFQRNQVQCLNCGATWEVPKEKETDVRIAVELMRDAFEDRFDTAIVVSGDGDLAPPMRAIREMYPEKRVVAAFPPSRSSDVLKHAADTHFTIKKSILRRCQMPDAVFRDDGFPLHRPDSWR